MLTMWRSSMLLEIPVVYFEAQCLHYLRGRGWAVYRTLADGADVHVYLGPAGLRSRMEMLWFERRWLISLGGKRILNITFH